MSSSPSPPPPPSPPPLPPSLLSLFFFRAPGGAPCGPAVEALLHRAQPGPDPLSGRGAGPPPQPVLLPPPPLPKLAHLRPGLSRVPLRSASSLQLPPSLPSPALPACDLPACLPGWRLYCCHPSSRPCCWALWFEPACPALLQRGLISEWCVSVLGFQCGSSSRGVPLLPGHQLSFNSFANPPF